MIAIVSPHFDDAVLSCWSVLTAPGDVVVVNVFTGEPPAGSGTRWWDRETGAEDSAARVRERHEEDRAALALAGRTAVGLGLLDGQYRDAGPEPDVLAALTSVLPQGCEIYAPATIGDHVDHALVRDAALTLRAGGARVTLYADLPHAITSGWPTWVADETGRSGVDAEWASALAAGGRPGEPAVVALAREERARKVQALRKYATQYEGLDALAFQPLMHPGTLRYEVFWPLL